MQQNSSKALRTALVTNVIFSIACGVIAAVKPAWLAEILLTSQWADHWFYGPMVLRAMGIVLLAFAAGVGFIASRPLIPTSLVKAVVVADIAWVILTAAFFVLTPSLFTEIGQTILIVIAAFVAVVAIGQSLGLALLYQGESTQTAEWRERDLRVRMSRADRAPNAIIWDVMADHEAYARFAENLAGVEVLEGEGMGMVRRCFAADGGEWTETANIWEPGRRYAFEIDTAAVDYPYPLDSLKTIWAVEHTEDDTSTVSMEFTAVPMRSVKGKIFGLMGRFVFPKVLDDVLDRWKNEMELRAAAELPYDPSKNDDIHVAPLGA